MKPLIILALCAAAAAQPAMEQRLAQAKNHPGELYQFLLRMPKGADLHNHLSGAVYAESYLRAAAEDKLCIDKSTYAIGDCGENRVEASKAASDNVLRNLMINSLSMRGFVAGAESGHDHFFATFGKIGPIKEEHRGEFIAEVVRRAAEQNELYLELMAINGNLANSAAGQMGALGDFDAAKDALMRSGLPRIVDQMRARIAEMDQGRRRALGCEGRMQPPSCRVVVRYMYEVIRESPPERIFAQVLAGFMLASAEPLLVGINFVAPEDGFVSMRDYERQMQMVDYAKRLYPNIHVSLHAGELAPGLVPPDGLRFHIREAVELGHAERIGHGVDILYENLAAATLELMKQRRIAVEINLTSNDVILGIRGKEHPFLVYRKREVPVVLSTDDEGVSRIDLTHEYARATADYGLSYADLKEISRNSLQYSFLPGAGYWKEPYRAVAPACASGPRTKSCQDFLAVNEKARVQAELEERFAAFENSGSEKDVR